MTNLTKTRNLLGAIPLGNDACRFLVWAPCAQAVELDLLTDPPRTVPMKSGVHGYFGADVEAVPPGTRYSYRLDGGQPRPDPASRYQPEGVHGPSQVIDLDFAWTDQHWHGLPLQQLIIYELHIGTFTAEGTLDAVTKHLDELQELGITAVELMPVSQFPGSRNWGYDGVHPFAVQNSYGGPDALRRLVDECHRRGLAVILDVVYNHLGPEGNYLADFGHYFTDCYKTPWGDAINFDGPHSDDVRRYFIENAIHWTRDFHIDALRLDAIHAIYDESARPFLAELAAAVHTEAKRLNRQILLIEESNKNDPRHVQVPEVGGYGLDGVWNDDLHHSIHAMFTDERDGYYADFGDFADLVKAYREGFVYDGRYSVFRQRRLGVSSRSIPAERFVVCSQNHDQVGNRLHGDRLSQLVSPEQLKMAAALVLLSPNVPLLFMGEEYGETAPFLYFVSHGDPELIEAVRQGRQQEFASFGWDQEIPDPQSEQTFRQSMLDRQRRDSEPHQVVYRFYQALIRLRQSTPALSLPSKQQMRVTASEAKRVLAVHRWDGTSEACVIFGLATTAATVELTLPHGQWRKVLDSSEPQWSGPGSTLPDEFTATESLSLELPPTTCALFLRESGSR